MVHIARGMECIHQRNLIHRDLKPDNIIVFDGGKRFKVADLGSVTTVSKMQQTSMSVAGTAIYMVRQNMLCFTMRQAPEIQQMRYNKSVDIWSFGILPLKLLERVYPVQSVDKNYHCYYDGNPAFRKHNKEFLAKKGGLLNFYKSHQNFRILFSITRMCLSFQPEYRPEFPEVLLHFEALEEVSIVLFHHSHTAPV
jgi:serine/threonine protein kinase